MRKRLIGIAICVALAINLLMLSLASRRSHVSLPAQDQVKYGYPVFESAHGKRVIKEIDRISKLSLEQMEAEIDNSWAIFNSGAVDGGSLMPQMDYPALLACRLRRRFIREIDKMSTETRRNIARRIFDRWRAEQRTMYAKGVDWNRDRTQPRPLPNEGLTLAIATGLFCCARWGSVSDVIERIDSTYAFSDELRKRLDEIPDVPAATRRLMPLSCIPDRDCLINILIYAAHRDPGLPEKTRDTLDQKISEYQKDGLVSVPVEWNAWDAKIDWFDIGPLKLGENAIERRPTDEAMTWYRFQGNRMSNRQQEMLDEIIKLLRDPKSP